MIGSGKLAKVCREMLAFLFRAALVLLHPTRHQQSRRKPAVNPAGASRPPSHGFTNDDYGE